MYQNCYKMTNQWKKSFDWLFQPVFIGTACWNWNKACRVIDGIRDRHEKTTGWGEEKEHWELGEWSQCEEGERALFGISAAELETGVIGWTWKLWCCGWYYLKEDVREDWARLLPEVHIKRIRGNSPKLYREKFRIDVRKTFSTGRVVQIWNRGPEMVWNLQVALKIFKSCQPDLTSKH